MIPMNDIIKFARWFDIAPSGCWLWRGSTRATRGYGVMRYRTRREYSHRFAYMMVHGGIPKSLVIDHLCRVRHCVNPAHLEAVTSGTNVLRGVGLTAVNKAKTTCPKGHPLAGDNVMRSSRADGRVSRKCRICNNANARRTQGIQRARAGMEDGENE